MTIDFGRMFCAISDTSYVYGYKELAFLNRRTGEIVFLYENEGEAEAWLGMDLAIDAVFDRARVEACPSDWLEIPKYDRRSVDQEEFIREFLGEHGIEAALA